MYITSYLNVDVSISIRDFRQKKLVEEELNKLHLR